jgi:hypothetical protein
VLADKVSYMVKSSKLFTIWMILGIVKHCQQVKVRSGIAKQSPRPVGRKGLVAHAAWIEAEIPQAPQGLAELERKARFAAFYAANAPKFRIEVKL